MYPPIHDFVASPSPYDSRDVTGQIAAGVFADHLEPMENPRRESRRPRREQVVTYRLRVDLRETRPPVWRRLELASDMFLDELHDVLQASFGWTNSHLNRFSVGSPWDATSVVYLCPVDDGDDGDDGIDARTVRLDELLVEPGDTLRYLYDYGDDWDHSIRLEHVGDRPTTTTRAWCTGGRRAGAPEDCGGVWGYQDLVDSGEVDGVTFDVDATNRALEAAG